MGYYAEKTDEPSDAKRWMEKEDEAKQAHWGNNRHLDGAKERGQIFQLERASGSN
jgi:hypothetical protein